MKKNIILGAGLSGLTYASKNPNCLILEKEDEIGGLCRSRYKKNFIFDYSGHLLHTKDSLLKQNLQALLPFATHTRKAVAYINKTKIPVPIQNNIHYFPEDIQNRILKTLPKKSIPTGNNTPFSLWCEQNFGTELYNVFFKPYNLKFWDKYFDKINSSWVKGFITNPDNTLKTDIQNKGYNASFMYPTIRGIGELAKKIAKKNNLKISTNTNVKKINFKDKVITNANGDKYNYNNLISSIPLPELKNMLIDLPEKIYDSFSKLSYTSVLNINIGLKQKPLFNEHWIYFPDQNSSFYRIGCYTNFAPSNSPKNHSSYYIEKTISQDENKTIATKTMIDDFIKIFKLSEENIIVTDEVFIRYAYVVFDKNREQSLKDIKCFLKDNNIYTIGRYGSWNYSSMNESLSL